jgi:protein O-GlcNAc transferase
MKSHASDIAGALYKARTLHQRGRLAEAEALYAAILRHDPDHFEALCLLGVIESQRGHFDSAVALFGKAATLDPNCALAHSSVGNALLALERHEEAVASFSRALAIEPNRSEVLNNCGNALFKLKRLGEALSRYDRALAIEADSAEILYNRGNVLRALNRHQEALASYDRALALRPEYAEALYNRGAALRELKRHTEALAGYDRLLAIRPHYAAALCDRANALLELGRSEEAIEGYDRALAVEPRFAEARYNRGIALSALARHEEAARQFAELLSSDPDFPYAKGELLFSRLHCCDWNDNVLDVARLERDVAAGKRAATPFAFLCASESPNTQLQCAKTYVEDRWVAAAPALWTGDPYRHDRIRVAYLSADFHDHATAHLTAELFELHDKSRFETHAISLGPDRNDEWRTRLRKAFTRFHDVRNHSDRDVAALLRNLEIDIAVDLKGHTSGSRPGILAFRPAPIQVNYLGYPGTMGADFIDYVLADRLVIPDEQHPFYTEKVVYLPDTYQPNDTRRRIDEHAPTRDEAGLPEDGFVFCSFVASYKISPPTFDSWMRLLAKVDGSALWLLAGNADAVGNLRRSAHIRGITPERLVFAPRVKLERHLARHRLADLFLDSLPINAHTTASDALWAGLPVVTCLGAGFAGRVAGSLLNALGLPELITETREDYEALALNLAQDRDRLAAVRGKLARNRQTHPLFDTDRLRRHIESAFETMSERLRRGQLPASFAVAPVDRA